MFILFIHYSVHCDSGWLYCPGTYFPSFASLRWFWNQIVTCGENKNVNNRSSSSSSSNSSSSTSQELSSFYTFLQNVTPLFYKDDCELHGEHNKQLALSESCC